MSTDRKKIREMNDRLRVDLGTDPEYGWVHSSNERGRMAFQICNEDKSPIFDYVCACGVNVSVHKPTCKSFVLPRAKYEIKTVIPKGCWAMCVRSQPDRAAWESMLPGIPYPDHGSWSPVSSDAKRMVLDADQQPTWQFTRQFIESLRESRGLGWDYVEERSAKREADATEVAHQRNMGEFDKLTGLRDFPGKVGGTVSLPNITPKSKNRAVQ